MLLITGYPGWLTEGFFLYLAEHNLSAWNSIRCLVHPNTQLSTDSSATVGTKIEIIRGDLRDREVVVSAVQGVSHVLHAAGVVHVNRTQDWYSVNTEYTKQLFDASVGAGVARFVFVSSNAAAGRSEVRGRLLTEGMPARPLSHYGRSKYLAEQYILSRKDQMETVVLRPCMFYGPPVPSRHVEIYKRIREGRMPLVGSGLYDRSVIHVQNLAELCYLALTRPEAVGQTYYAADDRTYTTKEIVDAMAAALGVQARFLRLPAVVAKVAYRLDMALAALGVYWQTLHLVGEADWNVGLSCEKAKRELGYTSRRSLNEGMNEAIEWCSARKLM
jgi:nucleoside-diphosphate-sugar epimerase